MSKYVLRLDSRMNLNVVFSRYEHEDVVVDGNIITSRGPATAFQFALKIVELLKDKKKAEEVAKILLMDDPCQ